MKKFKLIPSILMILLLSLLVFAVGSTTLTSPADNYIPSDNSVDFVCNATAQPDYNITAISIYTNIGGTWAILNTTKKDDHKNNTDYGISYTHSGINPGDSFIWNCEANYTKANDSSIIDMTFAPANKTVNVPYFGTVTLTSPIDNYYPLNDSVTLQCNGTGELNWNISSIDLFTNQTGTWAISGTETFSSPTNNTAIGNITTLTGITDGTHFIWNCRYNYTRTDASTNLSPTWASANKTVFVEYPPPITLSRPINGANVSSASQYLNFTVAGTFTTDTLFYCKQYSNDTGSWTSVGPTMFVSNDTAYNSTPYTFQEGKNHLWNIRCEESSNGNILGFAPANFTITVDLTDPTIILNGFTNASWENSAIYSINYTATDDNLKNCSLYVNTTGYSTQLNETNTTMVSGTPSIFKNSYVDGNYSFFITCYDYSGRSVNTSTYDFMIDTTYPAQVMITNNSRVGYCDQWNISVNNTEEFNISVDYGLAATKGSVISSSDYLTRHNIAIPNQSENTLYYFNVTVCDRAGNCNETSDDTYTFFFKICTGWTYLGIYERKINMSQVASLSGADYVYTWNQTGQAWVYYLGSASNANYNLKYGDFVALYNSDNSTWNQNRTQTGYYEYNISSGNNYLVMTTSYTFGNLSTSLMNSSDSWGLSPTSEINQYRFNFSNFAAYNNSAQDWTASYYYDVAYNMSWNNNTVLDKSSGLEVVWLYSNYNVSWNGTDIYANWTIW
ncbi:MAG: hypothetical protein ACTSX6_04795 [Candidatus Heimdallarchaeaceae archaeon]